MHIETAAEILTDTYKETWFRSLLKKKDMTEANSLRQIFNYMVKHHMKNGNSAWGLFVENALRGVALWFPRDFKPSISLPKVILMLMKFKLKSLLSTLKLILKYGKEDEKCDLFGHWRLQWLGLDSKLVDDPRFLGKLINPVLEWADQVSSSFKFFFFFPFWFIE
jgi:hypothetical protein